jgi:DNA-binding transcriptional LysR family regulator
MPLDPRRLLVLAAVRRAGGVLAAAKVLHLTPSAVSQQLARLETETGTAVLDRSRPGGGRAAVLTTAGELLAVSGERIAAVLSEAECGLAELTGVVRGPVRIGAFPTAIRRLVAPAVAELAVRHPAVKPTVLEIDPIMGRDQLHRGGLHLLLIDDDTDQEHATDHADPPPDSKRGGAQKDRLHELVLLDDPFQLVVPSHWAQPDCLDVLLHQPWVVGPAGSAAHAALHRLAASRGLPAPGGAHQALEYPAVLALVGAGLGAALVPTLALQQTPHPGVRTARPPVAAGARHVTALTRTGSSPAVRVVLDALLATAISSPVSAEHLTQALQKDHALPEEPPFR